ncbi:unnamed protein product [Closterium sp. NIES-54]
MELKQLRRQLGVEMKLQKLRKPLQDASSGSQASTGSTPSGSTTTVTTSTPGVGEEPFSTQPRPAASPTLLTFDAEGRAVAFDVWLDDLQLFLQCDSRDGLSLFDLTSGASTAPAADADSSLHANLPLPLLRLAASCYRTFSHDLLRSGVAIFDLDFDAILAVMYAVSISAEGDCYVCLPPDPGIEAAALGASESAALGASESAAPGPGEFALSGTASAQVFHTFTLDSGASRSFFRDRTTLMPLNRPVAVSLADPSWGLVLARYSTVSGADLQDGGVDQFTPAGQRVTHCTCAQTSRHLTTFTRRPGSSLYTLTTEFPPVAGSGQVAASSQVFAAASRSGMASRVLVSGLPRSLPPLSPGPAPTCVPCVEGRQCAAPHSSEFSPTEAPLQTLHMDVWGPARVRGQGHARYFLLVVDDYSRYTTVFPLRSKGEVTEVLIDWIRAARLQLRERFGSDFPVLRLHFEVAAESGASRGAEPGCAESGGAEPGGAESGGAEPGGAEPGGAGSRGAESERVESGGAEPGAAGSGGVEPSGAGPGGPSGALSWRELPSPQELREWFARRWSCAAGARGAAAAGGSASTGGTGAGGATGAGTGGSPSAGGAGATGLGGARTGGTGAAGPAGAPGAGAGGAAGVGATGGTGAVASVSAGGPAGAETGGGTGAGGAAGVGADAGSAGVVPAGSGGAARPRPYFVQLLE